MSKESEKIYAGTIGGMIVQHALGSLEMEHIIRDMVNWADDESNNQNIKDNVLGFVKRLIDTLAETHNAPFNWREIGSELAKNWNNGIWDWNDCGYEAGSIWSILELYNYGADECFGVGVFDEEEED
jgi:hypothetical protein